MTVIAFICPDGTQRTLDGDSGYSVMQVAVAAEIPGIVGECGGDMSCATCHVYVESAEGPLRPMSDYEEDLLDVVDHRLSNSRLACQIPLRDELISLSLRVPPQA